MKRVQHDLAPGSEPWKRFRMEHYGASLAAAMMGLSKHVTRTELLALYHSGIEKEFSEFVQTRILDRGHDVEALTRPMAEVVIGEDLYPAVYSYGKLSASCDGLVMDGRVAWECKQFNASLFASVLRGELPDEHQPQCQQVMWVTGAESLMFSCSDGTPDRNAWMNVVSDPEYQARIVAGWKQFNEDLASYQHVEVIPAAIAAPTMSLPALSIQVSGSISLIDNLAVFGERLAHFIANVDKTPNDDQAFADAEAAIKTLSAAEDALEAAKSSALAQTASIDEMTRTVALYAGQARTTRLLLEKIVKARKETIRVEIVFEGKARFQEHVDGLNRRIGKPWMPAIPTDFAGVIKGKKTVSSLRDAVDTELARAKIEANAIADRIALNLLSLHDIGMAGDFDFLFPDIALLALKLNDDFAALLKTCIAEHKAWEHRRLEVEREKIRAEEVEKIRREKEREEAAANDARMAELEKIQRETEAATAELKGHLGRIDEVMPEVLASPRPTDAAVVSAIVIVRPSDEEIVVVLAKAFGVSVGMAEMWISEYRYDN